MYDAVHLFAKALHDLDSSQQIDIKSLSCDVVDFWPHGYSLINYMRVVSTIMIFFAFLPCCFYSFTTVAFLQKSDNSESILVYIISDFQ